MPMESDNSTYSWKEVFTYRHLDAQFRVQAYCCCEICDWLLFICYNNLSTTFGPNATLKEVASILEL